MGLFDYYRPFEASFSEKYGDVATAFPFAMMVIEKELRNFHAGETHLVRRNITQQAARNPVKAFLLSIGTVFGPARGPSYYIKLSGFDEIESNLHNQLEKQGFRSFSHQKLAWFKRNKQLHGLTVRGRWFPRFARSVLSLGMDATVADHDLMDRLNRQIAANVQAVKRYIVRNDIRFFLSDGDCMFFQRVIIQATRELGIPYVVISHGFVTEPTLNTIAPVYADMFVAWTEDQRRDLSEATGCESAQKFQYFGFPKQPKLVNGRVSGQVLVVWHPFVEASGLNMGELERMSALIRQLTDAGLSTVLRLHPKDRSNEELLNALTERKIVAEAPSAVTSLSRADVIIGSLSSLLVEAASAGKPVFQLSDYPTIPDLPRIDLDDPGLAEKIRAVSGKTFAPYPVFDTETFCRTLLQLMDIQKWP